MRILNSIACIAAGLGLFLALPLQYAELHGQQRGCAARAGLGGAAARGRRPGADGGLVADARQSQTRLCRRIKLSRSFQISSPSTRASRTGREVVVQRPPVPRRLHLDGGRRENAAAIPPGSPHLVGRAGWADPVHDRRTGAVCRVERIPGAGAQAPHLQPRNGR